MLKRTLSGLMLLALTSLPAAAQARQFLQAPQYSTGATSNPQAFAIADFNNDGIPDVAVADSGTNAVSIFLGNGDGTFKPVNCSASLTCAVGNSPEGIVAADFNQDGNWDLAVTNFNSNTLTILFGNGSGGFTAQSVTPATGTNPRGIAVADFNQDGFPDIIVANSGAGNVGLFINNGSGGFGTQTAYTTGFNPWSVSVGDFNNDGVPDIVVANYNNNNELSVYLGTGGKTCKTGPSCFGSQFPVFTGTSNEGSPVSVAVGDFNGDGNLDVAAAVQGDGVADTVAVLLGKGNGGFATAVTYTTASFPIGIAAADLNGDGNIDLAVAAANGNVVTVFWGNGTGAFAGQVNCGTGDIPSAVAVANLSNAPNGQNDLIVSNSQGNSFSVIVNNGNGTFQSRLDYAAGSDPVSVVTADFNGDGIPDLALANSSTNQVSILAGNGDGTFQPPSPLALPSGSDPVFIVEADFNQDGIPDLAVVDQGTDMVTIFLGEPGGTFQFQSASYKEGNQNTTQATSEPTSIAVGDFNGDGYPDLAITNFHDNSVSILLNNGTSSPGTFASVVNYGSGVGIGNGPIAVAAAKLNGDQSLDLVVINETDNSATILKGTGVGTFTEGPVISNIGGNPLFVVTGDFNGDKIPDLAVADLTTQQVSVLLGTGSWQGNGFGLPTYYSVGAYPSAIVVQDFNGDGKSDLAVTSTPVNGSPGDEVSLLWGNGDGTFQPPAFFGAGYYSYSLVAGDFNASGVQDLAVANGKSNTVSILMNTQGTSIAFTSSSHAPTYGESVMLTATVAPSVPNGATPTGSVTFMNGSAQIGTAQTLSSGEASISTSALPAVTNSLAAVYSGDSNYQSHTVYLSQTVRVAISSTSLTSTPNPSAPNQTATFTASVSSPTAQPGGVVTFLDGSTSIGTETLNGSGQATFSTSTLATGRHNVTAVYAGNSNITGSTSSALQQVIAVPTAPSFSLAASWSTSSNIAPGATATALVTINPAGGLNPAAVQLTCTVSPSANPAATCQLGPVSVASGVGKATLTFKTSGPTSALLMPNDNHGSNMLFAVGLMIPALLLGGAGLTKPGRRKFMSFCLCLALAGCVASMACGGGTSSGGSTTPPPSGNSGTPAGSYQVMVSGSASGIQNSIPKPLSVTVQ